MIKQRLESRAPKKKLCSIANELCPPGTKNRNKCISSKVCQQDPKYRNRPKQIYEALKLDDTFRRKARQRFEEFERDGLPVSYNVVLDQMAKEQAVDDCENEVLRDYISEKMCQELEDEISALELQLQELGGEQSVRMEID
jgi:hypothetical protein